MTMQPPKRPKNEKASITIANQDRQIQMLCQRVTDLEEQKRTHEKRADENYESARQWRERCHKAEQERDGLRKSVNMAQSEIDYQRGYIARVKEGDRQMFGPEPEPMFPEVGSSG